MQPVDSAINYIYSYTYEHINLQISMRVLIFCIIGQNLPLFSIWIGTLANLIPWPHVWKPSEYKLLSVPAEFCAEYRVIIWIWMWIEALE